MDFDYLGYHVHIFGLVLFQMCTKFFKMSFREAYDAEYVNNIKKLPERLAIDPTNSRTMQKLKLKQVLQVNLMET